MAKYSVQLRNIIDIYGLNNVKSWFTNYKLEDYLTTEQINIIQTANIWKKEKLAEKIIDHYYMREIGFETPALFKHYAKVTMQELMEQYLPIIYSNAIKFDPLINVDYTESYERNISGSTENSGTSSSSSESSGLGMNIINNTPQTNISKQDIESGIYASNVNQSESDTSISDNTTTSNEGSSETLENYTKTIKGNSGVSATAQALIEQYRKIIRAVDKEIIDNLNSLFMGIY